MTVNGNGVSTGNGGALAKQVLQIIPINLVVIITVIGSAVALYYNLKADNALLKSDVTAVSVRMSNLEARPIAMTPEEKGQLFQRVKTNEERFSAMNPKIDRIETNVAWLVAREPNTPKK